VNASLYYENTDWGTLLSAIYNLTWDRIRDYSADQKLGLGGLTEARRNQLDLVFKQRITKFLTIKAGVQNVLNQKIRYYRDADESYSYNPSPDNVVFPDGSQRGNGDYIEQQYSPGAYYSIGLNFNF
jgi:outer membrane receptor protein involved in Fe transport